jgi:isopenicillin N synthase-like dioxygenase
MTRYPPSPPKVPTTSATTTTAKPQATFAINPHLDTSFFTVLTSNGPGLVVYSHKHNKWLRAPHKAGHFIVNSGTVLRTMTNDHWLATKHYATPPDTADRISLPFFFNPHPAVAVGVLPTHQSTEDPPKYQAMSYLQGPGVAQGE